MIIEALSADRNFLDLFPKAQELAKKIKDKAANLKTILSDYQTHDVTDYEIERSIRTLQLLHENSMYLGVGERLILRLLCYQVIYRSIL